MATTLRDRMKALPAKRRERIEARAVELIAEELSLRDLRKAHAMTQTDMAEALGVGQDGVSRIEQRSDLLISTLRSYVEAMGGHLHLVATFPDRPAVHLVGLVGMDEAAPTAVRRPASKKAPKHEAARN